VTVKKKVRYFFVGGRRQSGKFKVDGQKAIPFLQTKGLCGGGRVEKGSRYARRELVGNSNEKEKRGCLNHCKVRKTSVGEGTTAELINKRREEYVLGFGRSESRKQGSLTSPDPKKSLAV